MLMTCPRSRRAASVARILIAAFALTGVAGCGGSGGSGGAAEPPAQTQPTPQPGDDNGIALIGLTDAAGDFLSYGVRVTSIKLERANGGGIETLPESTEVDFALYVEATEFVTAASVPNGVYTGFSIVLDYTDAKVFAEDDAGDPLPVDIVDANGDPLGQTELRVDLNDVDRFVIAPGVPAHVTLDFDLEASHELDLSTTPATARLNGVLIADTLLEDPKPRRARGLLRNVDIDAGTFAIAIRPFYRPVGDFGPLTVHVDDTTEMEIDGVMYDARDGLAALAAKPVGTAVVVFGILQRGDRRFVADNVLAGSSVPWGELDIASGTVAKREGDTLTLRGTTLVRADMSVVFNDTLAVTLGAGTHVTQQGASLIAIGVDDISVGQRLTALGTLDGDAALDASEGHVRVRYSDLAGVTSQVSPFVVDLATINRRRASGYDYSGTGAGSDADPDEYEIDSGSLTLDGVTIGAPVRVRGLVAPFGTAPMDFYARTVGDLSALPARLRLRWLRPGSPDAFVQIDPAGIVVQLQEDALAPLHHFFQAGIPLDLLAAGEPLSLLPGASGNGVFALRQDRRVQVFFSFARFSEELAGRLDGSVNVVRIDGRGDLQTGNAFTPRRLLIDLN